MSIPLAKESYKYILILMGLTFFVYLLMPILAIIPAALLCFVAYFFRMPKRNPPDIAGAIIAPGEGKIIKIEEVYENVFFKQTMRRVSIFLSLFDVHITYSPIEGRIEKISYSPGRFNRADKDIASKENESNFLKIVHPKIEVGVKQIAGLIARRIVCWGKEGEEKRRGETIGLIKFGSRVELYLPLEVEIKRAVGEKVKGGETIIGVIK